MKKYLLTILILTTLVLTGCLGKPQTNQNTNAVPEEPEVENENVNTATTEEIDTSDWKTYRNEEYGFEFKYPGEWDCRDCLTKDQQNYTFFNKIDSVAFKISSVYNGLSNLDRQGKINFLKEVTKPVKDVTRNTQWININEYDVVKFESWTKDGWRLEAIFIDDNHIFSFSISQYTNEVKKEYYNNQFNQIIENVNRL